MLLEHKTAVIYGAAGAIGGAVARAFAHEGADLFLAGRTRARVESVAGEISAAGGVAEAAEVDALDEDAIEKHMDHVVARAQRIDVLFNAIGMDDVQGTLLVDMSAEDFAQPVIKATRTQFLTAPHHGGYGVACAAVEGLWRSFAAELGPHGIRLVILRSAGSPDAPDIKETFEHHARAAGISPEEFLAEASSGTLLRRLPMLSEVAEAAVVMASDRASAMTGVMANVTCGFWVDV
jgi:3-oxoacyl-[acyl-carrier protein] reductase